MHKPLLESGRASAIGDLAEPGHNPLIARRDFLLAGSAALASGMRAVSSSGGSASSRSGDTLKLQRLSWAGVKFECRNRTLFIDPWVSASIWDGAWTQPIVPVEATTPARNVLVTHLHNDHFDPDAIRAVLPANGTVLCAPDAIFGIMSRGFRPQPLQMYEPAVLDDFAAWPVPAVDGINTTQVSWIITCGGRRFIHCGDTLYHGAFLRIGRVYGPFDVAFLPINGAQVLSVDPQPGVPMTLTPEQAAGAALLLRARLVVPIHYGLHDPKSYLEYPNAVTAFVEAAGRRGVAHALVKPGESVPLPAGD